LEHSPAITVLEALYLKSKDPGVDLRLPPDQRGLGTSPLNRRELTSRSGDAHALCKGPGKWPGLQGM